MRLSKSTVFRLLTTMERNAFVERDGGRYRLGRRLHDIGAQVYEPRPGRLHELLSPIMAALYERSGKEPPPEENPALNAPLVAYLASEAAAHVNGQILGRTEYAYTLFQHPKQIAWMWKDGGWTAADVAERFDNGLGQHLQQVGMVMPQSMKK